MGVSLLASVTGLLSFGSLCPLEMWWWPQSTWWWRCGAALLLEVVVAFGVFISFGGVLKRLGMVASSLLFGLVVGSLSWAVWWLLSFFGVVLASLLLEEEWASSSVRGAVATLLFCWRFFSLGTGALLFSRLLGRCGRPLLRSFGGVWGFPPASGGCYDGRRHGIHRICPCRLRWSWLARSISAERRCGNFLISIPYFINPSLCRCNLGVDVSSAMVQEKDPTWLANDPQHGWPHHPHTQKQFLRFFQFLSSEFLLRNLELRPFLPCWTLSFSTYQFVFLNYFIIWSKYQIIHQLKSENISWFNFVFVEKSEGGPVGVLLRTTLLHNRTQKLFSKFLIWNVESFSFARRRPHRPIPHFDWNFWKCSNIIDYLIFFENIQSCIPKTKLFGKIEKAKSIQLF